MDDADAFSRMYERDSERVLLFLPRRTLDADVAVELTAETFALALSSWFAVAGGRLADAQVQGGAAPRGDSREDFASLARPNNAPLTAAGALPGPVSRWDPIEQRERLDRTRRYALAEDGEPPRAGHGVVRAASPG